MTVPLYQRILGILSFAPLFLRDNEWQYELFPVVGWSKVQIDDDAHDELFRSAPIVAGVVKDTYAWDLVLPDGRVIGTRSVYKNIEEWFDNAKAPRTGSKKGKNGSRKKRDTARSGMQLRKRIRGAQLLRMNSGA